MSGPKVVDIQAVRRRQQRQSTVRLRELKAVLEECLGLTEAASELRGQATNVLTELEGLRAAEQWTQLLVRTEAYCQLYRDEATGLRRRAMERRASELRREQRRRQGNDQLRAELAKLPASSDRDELLGKLAAAQNNEAAWSQVVGEIMHQLADSKRASMQMQTSQRLRELAAAYVDPAAGENISRLPGAVPDADERRLAQCWTLLAELEAEGSSGNIVSWKQQVQAAADEADPDQRGLMLDSLALDISSSLQASRAHQAAVSALQAALVEIEGSLSPEAQSWRVQISAAIGQPSSAEEMTALANSARTWVAQEQTREDVREHRAAVLRGLAALGYEVREGMSTAWTEQGRIVLHKPNDPQYGVEFSAPAASTALQARVVASGAHTRSQQRDREVEEVWCREFARLRALLAAEGFTTDLVRANAPGAVPVKTFENAQRSAVERSLPRQAQR